MPIMINEERREKMRELLKKVREYVLPLDFKKCPICGCTVTVSSLAIEPLKVSGKVKREVFVHCRTDAVPLYEPTLAIGSVPTLIRHFDTCARCGMEYCTRAEVVDAPIQYGEMPKGMRHGRG